MEWRKGTVLQVGARWGRDLRQDRRADGVTSVALAQGRETERQAQGGQGPGTEARRKRGPRRLAGSAISSHDHLSSDVATGHTRSFTAIQAATAVLARHGDAPLPRAAYRHLGIPGLAIDPSHRPRSRFPSLPLTAPVAHDPRTRCPAPANAPSIASTAFLALATRYVDAQYIERVGHQSYPRLTAVVPAA